MVPGVGNQRKKTRISHNKQEYFSFDSLLDIDPELLLCSEDASASQIGSVGHRASLFQNLVSSQVFWTTHLAATTDNQKRQDLEHVFASWFFAPMSTTY